MKGHVYASYALAYLCKTTVNTSGMFQIANKFCDLAALKYAAFLDDIWNDDLGVLFLKAFFPCTNIFLVVCK